ncbi:cytochrome P450 2K1-like [Hyperolius riggenbachi]|uniref:cytochrome P450 2K1-like n=1 Tax=Hyperolius riggenbachi TaxID=752182 RepID=UPI0035A3C28D
MTFFAFFLSRTDLLLYFTISIALFIYWINASKRSTARMPPGPKPLPLIGNLNLLDLKKPFESLMELSEKYGEVFTVHFGPKKMVVLAGYNTVKDALINQADDFGDRADIPISTLLTKNNGIIFSNGESWKTMRRFTLSALRDLGMGKKTVEARIQDEVTYLIDSFKSYNGKPFDTNLIVNSAVSNIVCSTIFGKRFEYDDPVFQTLIRVLDDNNRQLGAPRALLFNFFPRIGFLLGAHKKVEQNINDLKKIFINSIKHRKQEFDVNDISGYIDAYLLKQEKDQESSKADKYFNDENLVHSILDLFAAGTDTTSTTLRWAILLMMKYPEIQKKVQEEIQAHVKQGQMPTVDDRKNMPYTDAVIHEIQRFGNVVPLNVSHTTPRDVFFRGYCIPKGTEVIPFLTSVLYDKTQWETPYKFNPNHFLDGPGKFVRRDAFMPFSAGRRACVGEGLARMALFIFFTELLQAFTFHPPPGVSREEISLKPGIGFSSVPLPYLVCAKLNN